MVSASWPGVRDYALGFLSKKKDSDRFVVTARPQGDETRQGHQNGNQDRARTSFMLLSSARWSSLSPVQQVPTPSRYMRLFLRGHRCIVTID